MRNNLNRKDWDRRIVDFDKIHGDSSEAYQKLLKSINLREGMKIGDLMCGYGDVSYHLLDESRRKNAGISIFLLDSSEVQLDNSFRNLEPYNLNGNKVVRVLGDARECRFEKESLDTVIIKMGLHEVPFQNQKRILQNAVDSLKQKGRLYIWESFGLDPELNEYFRDIVRKKDELAGFHQIAKNRYFPNQEEIVRSMSNAGLSNVNEIYSGDFKINPLYLVDLNNNPERIEIFNSYVRKLLPEKVKRRTKFEDNGNSVQMTFTKKIFGGIKP